MSFQDKHPAFLKGPFFYFASFLLANSLLSFCPLPMMARFWVGFLGILAPLVFALAQKEARTREPVFSLVRQETIPLPIGFMAVILVVGVLARFYRLVDLHLWPTRDEGNYLFMALDMMGKDDLPFFYGIGEVPPPFRWGLAQCFNLLGPSFFSLWLYPALWSLAILPVGYWAVRSFSSKSFSLLFLCFLAVGFWPLWLSRFCVVWVAVVFWECLTLGALGRWWKGQQLRWALGLGLCVGTGFFISPFHWPAVALVVILAVLWKSFEERGARSREGFLFFFIAVSLTSWPILSAIPSHLFGRHIQEVWGGTGSLFSTEQLVRCGYYLAGIFWGYGNGDYNYDPVWGGFLNPVLGAFVLSGLVYLAKFRRRREARLIALALFLFFIPGFVTHDLEMQRIVILLPLLLLVGVLGILSLASQVPGRRRMAALVAVLLLSAGLDLYGMAGPLARVLDPPTRPFPALRSEESYRACQVLGQKAAKDGPGLVFLDFVSVPLDQTLRLGTYSFNAKDNPGLIPSQANWMALLTNVNYRPFLEKRFPEAEWTVVGSKLLPWDGELMLGIVPLNPTNLPTVSLWWKRDRIFQEMTAGLLRMSEGKSREEILAKFMSAYRFLKGDPFLESSFWEIAYFNHSADKNFEAARQDLEMILKEGYPAAHIYNELGGLLVFEKNYPEAKSAFEKAVRLGDGHTPAADNLRLLEVGHP